jgi:hypothetical protein
MHQHLQKKKPKFVSAKERLRQKCRLKAKAAVILVFPNPPYVSFLGLLHLHIPRCCRCARSDCYLEKSTNFKDDYSVMALHHLLLIQNWSSWEIN